MAVVVDKDEKLRQEVRAWIEDNKIEEVRNAPAARRGDQERSEAQREWERRLIDGHWVCPHWPEEYGGRGLDSFSRGIVAEEFARAGYPLVNRGMGESLVSPAI